jgi:hypothetical protein
MATVIIPLFAKPASASLSLIMPKAKSIVVAENNINPVRITSIYKATIIKMITPITIYPSVVNKTE